MRREYIVTADTYNSFKGLSDEFLQERFNIDQEDVAEVIKQLFSVFPSRCVTLEEIDRSTNTFRGYVEGQNFEISFSCGLMRLSGHPVRVSTEVLYFCYTGLFIQQLLNNHFANVCDIELWNGDTLFQTIAKAGSGYAKVESDGESLDRFVPIFSYLNFVLTSCTVSCLKFHFDMETKICTDVMLENSQYQAAKMQNIVDTTNAEAISAF